jgi:sugar phosphate isomerase/epimerase
MDYSRREFGKIALASMPGIVLLEKNLVGAPLFQAKPNSKISGVQIGTITYSFRSMPDQSAEATLKYIVDSGISAVELMGGPVNDWARKKGNYQASPAAAAAAAGRAAAGGGRGGGRGGGGAAGPGGDPAAGRGAAPSFAPKAGMMTGLGNTQSAGQWNGETCPAGRAGGGARGAAPDAAPAAPGAAPAAAGAATGAAAAAPQAGGRGGGRGAPQTPEEIAAADADRKWRMSLSMDIFKELRKMYNDAGVSIYAVKDVRQGTDEDLDYTFTVARTLGASHVTLELPGEGPNTAATFKRLGDWALKYKMYTAYHTHAQGGMEVFDQAFAISKGNHANVDFGHFVAGGNKGGTPLDFLQKFHDRISSFHLKDRTTPDHCTLNLPWGSGETPIKEILQMVKKNKWDIPGSIELEYAVPEGSDAVKEVRKCLEYCRAALA